MSCTLVRETITHGYTLTTYTGYPAALSVLRHTDNFYAKVNNSEGLPGSEVGLSG